MALSQNQNLTLWVAFLSIVISGAVSGIGIFIQHNDLSKDRTSRCRENIDQFQSDLSVVNDSLLKSAGDVRLGIKTREANKLNDILVSYRRSIRLLEKKLRGNSCSSNKGTRFRGLTSEIDSVRTQVFSQNEFKLNKLIDLGKRLAQDESLSIDCCN
jgi:hypothetical protein